MAGKLGLFIAFLQIASVVSLSCYQCEHSAFTSDDADMQASLNAMASTDSECKFHGEEFLLSSLASSMSCYSSQNGCLKMYYKLNTKYEGIAFEMISYQRNCIEVDENELGCFDEFDDIFKDNPELEDGEVEACTCETDLCNAASGVTVGYMTLMLSAIVAFWKL